MLWWGKGARYTAGRCFLAGLGALLRVICDVSAASIDRDGQMEGVVIGVCEMVLDRIAHPSALREGGEAM